MALKSPACCFKYACSSAGLAGADAEITVVGDEGLAAEDEAFSLALSFAPCQLTPVASVFLAASASPFLPIDERRLLLTRGLPTRGLALLCGSAEVQSEKC